MAKLSSESSGALRGRLQYYVGELRRQARIWAGITVKAFQEAFSPDSQLVASSIAFFTLFSLFPLALLVVAIASRWLDPLLAESRVVAQLEFVAPGIEALLGSNLERLATARAPITGIALLMLIWSASSAFNVLTRAMDRVWGADINRTRFVVRHRTIAVILVLSITGLLLVALTAEGTILTILNSLLPEELSGIGPYSIEFWAIFLNTGLFTLLYYFLPHVRLTWREVLPGAIVGGMLWELAKRVFLIFIGTYLSRSNLIYGSVTTLIGFLAWTYASSLILLFGAYLNHQASVARGGLVNGNSHKALN